METRGGGRAAVALRVLVIDGTQGRGELMAQHLRAEGMEPTVVASAQDAWNSLEWAPADVVLLRAGGDLAEACEMAPALARRGVVLVTASAEPVRPEVRRQALAAGVQDLLVAPFDAREMAARLDAATFDAAAAAGRPRVAVAVDDDARTRAEARPAALVAEEAGALPEALEALPEALEALPEALEALPEALEARGADTAAPGGVSEAGGPDAPRGEPEPLGAEAPAPAVEAPAPAVEAPEPRGVDADAPRGVDADAAADARAAEPFDAIGALSEDGLLNWLGDEDDMPGTIPAGGWHGGQDLTASDDFRRLMAGDCADPALDGPGAVDTQIGVEAARLGTAGAGLEGGDGPDSGMGALRIRGEDDLIVEPFGGGGAEESAAEGAEKRDADEPAVVGKAAAAPRMDVELAELEVGPGTRNVFVAGLGRARRERLMWRTATAMMGTVLLGLVGIVGWKLLAAPAGTSPEAGLVAGQALSGGVGGEASNGALVGGDAAVAAAGRREPEAPEPSSPEESNALLFGQAVEALSAGWPDDADDRLRLLLRSDPTHRRGMAGLASALAQQGEFGAARVLLDALAEQGECEPGALLTLGLVAHRLGDTEGARRGLERFVEAAPKDPRAEQVRRLLASLGAG